MGALTEQIEQQAEEAARRAERLQKMAELARELGDEGIAEFAALIKKNGNGNANGKPKEPKEPRGREAIRRIVADRPGIWTLTEFREAMRERGWFTSARAAENAVLRLASDGEGRRIGKGRYVFPANHGEEDVIESDPSDGAMIPFKP